MCERFVTIRVGHFEASVNGRLSSLAHWRHPPLIQLNRTKDKSLDWTSLVHIRSIWAWLSLNLHYSHKKPSIHCFENYEKGKRKLLIFSSSQLKNFNQSSVDEVTKSRVVISAFIWHFPISIHASLVCQGSAVDVISFRMLALHTGPKTKDAYTDLYAHWLQNNCNHLHQPSEVPLPLL